MNKQVSLTKKLCKFHKPIVWAALLEEQHQKLAWETSAKTWVPRAFRRFPRSFSI